MRAKTIEEKNRDYAHRMAKGEAYPIFSYILDYYVSINGESRRTTIYAAVEYGRHYSDYNKKIENNTVWKRIKNVFKPF